MKKANGKADCGLCLGAGRLRGTQTLLVLVTLCIVFVTIQVPQLLIAPSFLLQINVPNLDAALEEAGLVGLGGSGSSPGHRRLKKTHQRKLITNDWDEERRQSDQYYYDGHDKYNADHTPGSAPSKLKSDDPRHKGRNKKNHKLGSQTTHEMEEENVMPHELKGNGLPLQVVVEQAWHAGKIAWQELEEVLRSEGNESVKAYESIITSGCPNFISLTGNEFENAGRIISLPCGLVFGSSINLIATPHYAHSEYKPPIARVGEGESQYVMVSQFGLELHGLKEDDGEDPPRILHLNPRLQGDWSWKPVIEHNTCYRGEWGSSQRCEGWPSSQEDNETVDDQLKCEAWLRDDAEKPRDSEKSWWLHSFMGTSGKDNLDWEYPFAEGRLFILNLRAGIEGFHLTVDGRHVSSFPYHSSYVVEEITGFSMYGDLDYELVTINALPPVHPSYISELVLEEGQMWKAPSYPMEEIDLFVGVMSSSNHFSERMAVRKTWFQSRSIQSSNVVARFFVALHADKNINLQVRKEADYYGDMIILPFIDRYDIVVLKTVAICEFGIQNVTAKYIMKTDDDTFVRVDDVLVEVKATGIVQGLYMGSMNEFHRPLRTGKWAVTSEEWPERIYPTYANGPGYILSKDIVQFIVSQSKAGTLQLFKMEDVSVGLWVGQYGQENHLQYENSARFAQAGCISDYLTAHYQSPHQMMCLWDKLLATGLAECC